MITITSVTPNSVHPGSSGIVIEGTDFGSSGAIVEICDSPYYVTAEKHIVANVTYQNNIQLIIDLPVFSLYGLYYIHVTKSNGDQISVGYNFRITPECYPTYIFGGYGQDAVGRHQFGSSDSKIEPRLDSSFPVDESTNINIKTNIVFTIYCFSSILDLQNGINIEISEDGGLNYNNVEGPDYSLVYRMQSSQIIWFHINKLTGYWPVNTEIKIRCTDVDEYGQMLTKEVPVKWIDS